MKALIKPSCGVQQSHIQKTANVLVLLKTRISLLPLHVGGGGGRQCGGCLWNKGLDVDTNYRWQPGIGHWPPLFQPLLWDNGGIAWTLVRSSMLQSNWHMGSTVTTTPVASGKHKAHIKSIWPKASAISSTNHFNLTRITGDIYTVLAFMV